MIVKKLQAIQSELDVPKSQFNAFGKYYYRNAEDILAAAKPICIKHDCLLTVTDEIVMLGDRFYVKATACIAHDGEKEEVTAYAREELTKKGMDASQITGSASSYARKYALNGLFCLDDVKDADHGVNNGNDNKSDGKNYHKATYEKAKETFNSEITKEDEEYLKDAENGDGDGCVTCGKSLTKGQRTLAEKKHGKIICPECQSKEGK